jgi:hypothetical protein
MGLSVNADNRVMQLYKVRVVFKQTTSRADDAIARQ